MNSGAELVEPLQEQRNRWRDEALRLQAALRAVVTYPTVRRALDPMPHAPANWLKRLDATIDRKYGGTL